jgi:hypothetical protein
MTSSESLCGFWAEEVPLQVVHPVLPVLGGKPGKFADVEDVPVFVCGRLGTRNTTVLDFAFLCGPEVWRPTTCSSPSRQCMERVAAHSHIHSSVLVMDR